MTQGARDAGGDDALAAPAAARYASGVEIRDVEAWQLVDERLDEVRRLPYDELIRRTRSEPEVELLEDAAGIVRRSTRVVALPRERLGVSVRVDAGGRRARAEGGLVITASGEPAPEWSQRGEPPQGNPFAFGWRGTVIGLVLCALLALLFIVAV